MLGVNLAQLFSKEDRVYIWRKSEDIYWVSDGIVLVKLSGLDWLEFKFKYNNYKRCSFILKIEIGQIVMSWDYEDFKEIEYNLLEEKIDLEHEKICYLSDFYYYSKKIGTLVRLYSFDDEIRGVQKKYSFILDAGDYYAVNGKNCPVVVYDDRDSKIGLIMPVRYGFKEDLKLLLKTKGVL